MAEIKKIVFDIDGKKVEMSPEEAKQLFNILKDMFGEKTQYLSPPVIVSFVQPAHPAPWEYPNTPIVTCGTTNANDENWTYHRYN